MGRDHGGAVQLLRRTRFQSTLPAWGETTIHSTSRICRPDFNPLSPHGERQGGVVGMPRLDVISIHSPRMGRDPPGSRRYSG